MSRLYQPTNQAVCHRFSLYHHHHHPPLSLRPIPVPPYLYHGHSDGSSLPFVPSPNVPSVQMHAPPQPRLGRSSSQDKQNTIHKIHLSDTRSQYTYARTSLECIRRRVGGGEGTEAGTDRFMRGVWPRRQWARGPEGQRSAGPQAGEWASPTPRPQKREKSELYEWELGSLDVSLEHGRGDVDGGREGCGFGSREYRRREAEWPLKQVSYRYRTVHPTHRL